MRQRGIHLLPLFGVNKEIRVYSYDLHLGDMLSDPGDGRGGDNYHDS